MAYADLGALPLTSSIVWKNYMITVGGEGTSDSAIIRRALLNPDGSLGAWETTGQLVVAKVGIGLAISESGLLYIVGGVENGVASADGSAVSQGQKVFKCQLNERAEIVSPISELGALPQSLVNPHVSISGGYMYVSGGQSILTSLAYDAQPAAFTGSLGGNIVGLTSGESAPGYAFVDNGADGTISVQVLNLADPPSYTNNEIVYDDAEPYARALVDGATSSIRLDYDNQVTNFTTTKTLGVFTDVTDYSTLAMTGVLGSQADNGATGTLVFSSAAGDPDAIDGLSICERQGVAVANLANYKKLDFLGQASNFAPGDFIGIFSDNTDYSSLAGYGTIASQTDAGATGTLNFLTANFTSTPPIDALAICVRQGVATCDGALYKELNYDAQSGDFTVGQVVTGTNSGAFGTIISDVDGGATGILRLNNITGAFQDDEPITDPITGAAVVDGVLSADMLNYDAQTQDFTLTARLFGVTSGASAIIDADTDGGTSGRLTLSTVAGVFQNNEALIAYSASVYADADGEAYDAIDYDGQTENFTTTARLFGVTSGAKAIIDTDTDGGTTGTLTLSSLSGTFQNNEAIVAYSAAAFADVLNDTYVTFSFDGKTGYFANGETVTGFTSGATLTINSLTTQGGGAGTLRGILASGVFEDDEKIYSAGVGGALANGILTLETDITNTAYRARIMADGSLGAWTTIGDIS